MDGGSQATLSAKHRKLRRLNGRLQACDPCRQRKVPCDHGQPVCQRCIRKKGESQCTYTISAHSVAPFESAQSQTSVSPPGYPSPVSHTLRSRVQKPVEGTAGSQTPGDTPGSSSGANPRASGYLGYASYTTVIDEARESLPVDGRTIRLQSDVANRRTEPRVSDAAIDRGVAVLRHLPTLDNAAIINKEYFLMHDWIYRIAMVIFQKLYEQHAFGAHLGEDRDEDCLRQMSRTVCLNTAQPVDDSLEAKDWIAQFSGPNLRWESIGLLLTFWDLTRRARRTECRTPSADDENWRGITNACLELCDEFSAGNLMVLNLYHRRTTLESMTSGDASLRTAKSHAQTIACLTFLGYHAEPPTQPYVPTLASELKRVIYSSIHGADKTFSSFTGRPPLMSNAFATTPLPLDLDSEHLFGSQSHLESVAATTLDERGWNTMGNLYGATCSRARGMLKGFRDEILAIALGSKSDREASVDTLLDIAERQAATVAGFPATIPYRPEDISNPEITTVRIFTQLMISTEALQNGFFLDRLLLRRGYDSSAHLLLTSFRMVSNTLALWTNYERFAVMKTNFQWMLMAYGAPAGGILCKELQKPTLPGGRHPDDPQITRSSIIQKLSLLVGFLDWVDPAAPNAELCNDCKTVIKLVLDQTLNGSGGLEMPSMASQIEFEFPRGLDFNFDLMDSFDWLGSEL
ncbi:hypothetical protein Micbo1qcDRAFT_152534 [Microdochium bolleyi]|uniref:Zn(2)-C6 fungal-type domain-containing protein n=1 Tax=Microdochium bolleyi TaxID=196109 RepID=A0A136IPV2_9PEZI|nr:hypothetical protein Micbo1qcDRAFT_152534 [Microdochium bolleyi]